MWLIGNILKSVIFLYHVQHINPRLYGVASSNEKRTTQTEILDVLIGAFLLSVSRN